MLNKTPRCKHFLTLIVTTYVNIKFLSVFFLEANNNDAILILEFLEKE